MSDRARPAGVARGAIYALAWTVLAFLVLPVLVVFPVSVTDRRYLAMPERGISFQHYAKLLSSPDWLASIGNSVAIAVLATAAAVLLGTLCAVGCWRLASRASEAVRTVMLLPIVVPSIVYSLGLYRLYVDVGLLDTFAGVALAHAVTGIPYVVITVSASLASFDARLEHAARSLGATPAQALRRVILPNILPGVLSGAIFAFIHSWDETIMVLFVAGRTVYTLPRRIWADINENLDPVIAAVAVLLIAVTLALLLAERALRGPRGRAGSAPEAAGG
ncbi:MAG TPA: ABC transporter permease [Methylomirabilota bacterium]|nr:ABC transporter permease [Methylomirabilota bacterium]